MEAPGQLPSLPSPKSGAAHDGSRQQYILLEMGMGEEKTRT